MCQIVAGYFDTIGVVSRGCNQLYPVDSIVLKCIASIPITERLISLKAEMKFKMPSGQEYSVFSGYQSAGLLTDTLVFTSPVFDKPIPPGVYNTVWFVIYDSVGNALCQSNGIYSGYCNQITIIQQPTRDISITVRDSTTFLPISNVKISIHESSTGYNFVQYTDSSGIAVFPLYDISYPVTLEKFGYITKTMNITVNASSYTFATNMDPAQSSCPGLGTLLRIPS